MTTLPVPADATGVSELAIDDNGEIAGALYPISGNAAHAASAVAIEAHLITALIDGWNVSAQHRNEFVPIVQILDGNV